MGIVRHCWGNYALDYLHGDSVGNSGGLLCVWDSLVFRKSDHTISDYFVLLRGVWLTSGFDLLVVVVYAPHDPRDKSMVWDYLATEIKKWKGKVILMGDFNEVRYKSDRFGSVFNAKGALAFNSFIEDAELEEINLGGIMFTWCHKSGTKMSKLDRFFLSNNLLNSCPQDHRPILLRETECDYGPTPFRFFHHWLELDGFNNFVVDSCGLAPGDGKNAMRNLVYKLKFLKEKIRV